MKAALVFLGFVSMVSLVTARKENVVIDISHHNGKVDLEAARNDGITTVIHKATQGITFVDPYYLTNKAAAEKAGLTWAAYHFADNTDGAEQAEHFLKHAGTVKWYVVDFEENPIGKLPNTVGKAQAEALVEKIKEKTGSYPIVYGSKSFLDDLDSQVLAKCPLWLASYRSKPTMPKNWKSWMMWQYTNGTEGPGPHTVKGISMGESRLPKICLNLKLENTKPPHPLPTAVSKTATKSLKLEPICSGCAWMKVEMNAKSANPYHFYWFSQLRSSLATTGANEICQNPNVFILKNSLKDVIENCENHWPSIDINRCLESKY